MLVDVPAREKKTDNHTSLNRSLIGGGIFIALVRMDWRNNALKKYKCVFF